MRLQAGGLLFGDTLIAFFGTAAPKGLFFCNFPTYASVMEVITVMKIIPYLLAASLTTTLTANARPLIKRVVEETFTVQPGGQLTVETSGGEVKVRPGSDDKVRIVAHQNIRASTDAEAGKLLEKLTFKLEQSGNDVTALAKYEKRTFGFRSGS